jgi:hypothetical protein
LDSFKAVIVVAVILSLVSLVFISVVTDDAIRNAKTPDEEYGVVTAKAPQTDTQLANYSVTLANGKTLHIQSNTTLYDSIEIDKSYLFECRLDFTNQMTLVDSARQVNRTAT